jgi:bacterioferritin-associated ferredoxin
LEVFDACDVAPRGTPIAGRLTISRNYLQMVLMIICVCRDLNTAKVNDAIAAGARSPSQVHKHHQTRINCGKCCETVCEMIREQAQDDARDGQRTLIAAE